MEEKGTITVLMVEPWKEPYVTEIGSGLRSLQKAVGGYIQAVYPSEIDEIAVVLNEEGKLNGLIPNRWLRDEDGRKYDYICGTFFVCGLGEETFAFLSPELIQKYTELFKDDYVLLLNLGKSQVPKREDHER